jgi:hypothetical protein
VIGMTTRQVQLGTSAYTTVEDDSSLGKVGDLSLLLQLGTLAYYYSWGQPLAYRWGRVPRCHLPPPHRGQC